MSCSETKPVSRLMHIPFSCCSARAGNISADYVFFFSPPQHPDIDPFDIMKRRTENAVLHNSLGISMYCTVIRNTFMNLAVREESGLGFGTFSNGENGFAANILYLTSPVGTSF